MGKLYFGVCPYGSLCDVIINTLAGWSDDWVQPCAPTIRDDGQPIHEHHEQYVIDLTRGNPMVFRDLDWTDRMLDLRLLTGQCKNVWVGTFHQAQADLVKREMGDDVVTVGISFEPETRPKVIENLIACNPNKDYEPLVPQEFKPVADILIPLEAMYDPFELEPLLDAIDGPRNDAQSSYYFNWYLKNEN